MLVVHLSFALGLEYAHIPTFWIVLYLALLQASEWYVEPGTLSQALDLDGSC